MSVYIEEWAKRHLEEWVKMQAQKFQIKKRFFAVADA